METLSDRDKLIKFLQTQRKGHKELADKSEGEVFKWALRVPFMALLDYVQQISWELKIDMPISSAVYEAYATEKGMKYLDNMKKKRIAA
jgi:hypothetical protein